MRLSELLKNAAVVAIDGDSSVDIRGLAYSSADVGPGFLFAAWKGALRDGLEYVPEAVAGGAVAVLSDRPQPAGAEGAVWVRVPDPREALALAAAEFYGRPADSLKIVGLTGTKGKTTISYILESILGRAGLAVGVIGTISNRGPGFEVKAARTTPESVDLQRILREMLDRGVTHCVMEVSSHSLALSRTAGIGFDIAVFTNLTGEHLDFHQTMEDYFLAKKKLFFLNGKKKRTAVVNQDDPWGRRLIPELPMNTVTFGFEPAALVRAERAKFSGAGVEALVKYPGGQAVLTAPLAGRYNLSNLLAAFAAAMALGVPVPVIAEGIAGLGQVPGRFEKVEHPLGFHVIVDYAHTDAALQSLLETVRELKPGRILLVFGAGGDRDKAKRPRMGEVAARLADWTYLTSDNPRTEDPARILAEIEMGFAASGSDRYTVVPDRREAIARALAEARPGDFVILAGKGHETTQTTGTTVVPFNDVDVARDILSSMGGK
ncbi:MAG: UDP-N-acetylmuramoyl-L-alanyl-D-glutamate--2,6-diaminopimelate ligase [Candidatus Aminicenantes bacterium]|nr:UDP-N-acetylmuramoyl-L-alanyl-D-glutamate--2,6-diaminopimelate ligase [Candidatus Aminicenantes bacterium]